MVSEGDSLLLLMDRSIRMFRSLNVLLIFFLLNRLVLKVNELAILVHGAELRDAWFHCLELYDRGAVTAGGHRTICQLLSILRV